ncbi:MAG: hypothetical protein HOZ81_20575 [Streptomyces sp.]|nr:hypothetical protein [Streptomyces sp.]NUS24420.1 hypothetical protein [Streptomyces sp.]
MGFVVEPKAYHLKFDESSDLAGLEVTARSLNTGQFLEFQEAQAVRARGGEAAKGATQQMLEMLSGAILSWNAETPSGEAIPHTMDGLRTLDLDFNMAVIDAWMDALNGVSAPLPQTSTDGAPSVEASIPMDAPSASLAS